MDRNQEPLTGGGLDATGWSQALACVLADPGLVRPHVQPIVDLKRGVTAGYELLARFDHPLGESPAEWFATAYALGCVDELDAVILEAARRRLPTLPANTFLSVNLTSQGAISKAVLEAIEIGPRLEPMVVELTEQTDVDDIEHLAAAAEKFRARGAMIAIDDAGAGYAGLQRILAVRPEFIKIDRSLVSELQVDSARAATIEMLGALASRIDAWIVAEGVERRDQLERLVQMGVPLAQGYLFARPAPTFEQPDTSWIPRARDGAGRHADSLGRLLESVQPALQEAGADELGWRFADDDALEYLPIVDGGGRPISLIERDVGEVGAQGLLRVEATARVTDTLQQAMMRPKSSRLDPVVCCDEEGRYVGLARVERMVETLAEAGGPAGGPLAESA